MHHDVEASLPQFRSYVRTKAISRKLAKRKAELESEAYQVGSFRGASLECVGLIEAARGQCRQTAVF